MCNHILIIDDDRVVLAMAKDFLSAAGFHVTTAESGIYSNHIIYCKNSPNLILMDVMMPLMSGVKKARILKQREKSRNIPILLISSKDEQEMQKLCMEADADGYLLKPFTAEVLVEKVRQYLAV